MAKPDVSGPPRLFAVFARFWSLAMVPVIERSGGWPGFRYDSTWEDGMRQQAVRLPHAMARFQVFSFVNAIITIGVFVAIGYPTVWLLDSTPRAGAALSDLTVGVALGSWVAVGLGFGVPFGMLTTCALYRRVSWNRDLTQDDAVFGRRLFARVCQQTARVGLLVCGGLIAMSLWPSAPQPTAIGDGARASRWSSVLSPLVAALINGLTFWFYYGRERGETR